MTVIITLVKDNLLQKALDAAVLNLINARNAFQSLGSVNIQDLLQTLKFPKGFRA